jgi:ComF family protein
MVIADLLFPKECLNCKDAGSYICRNCLGKLEPLRQICANCGRPAVDGATHVKCKRPWGLDGLIFIWPYGGVIRKAILGLKYKHAKEITKEVGEYMVDFLQERKVVLPKKAILMPIPLYFLRQNWRGFNQVEEIGKLVAFKMQWEYRGDILLRKRLKKPQTSLKRHERAENIRGVFELNPNYQLQTTSYILLDDVYTTGATMKEAAKVFKRKGAKKVWGIAIAR